MKQLKKLLLIHWHYFDYQLVEFDQLNFLTGQNASGKSTLIDALQLVLLGDFSGSFFNKSAGGRTNRNLKGYLMGELGDDEQSGFRYLRDGRFTSYIVLEFHDEEKDRDFTAGAVFDVYAESDIQKMFFSYEGPLDEGGFLRDQVPMDITRLRGFLRQEYDGNFDTTDTGKTFREKLYGRLGGLKGRFGALLKKAVSFNPDVDLQKFITEFVCDDQLPVDISHMQENIRSYRQLEEESLILTEKTQHLEAVVTAHQDFEKYRESEQMYSYLIQRGELECSMESLTQEETRLAQTRQTLAECLIREELLNQEIQQLRLDRDELVARQVSDRVTQLLERLDGQIAQVEEEIRTIRLRGEQSVNNLRRLAELWGNASHRIALALREMDFSSFPPLIAQRLTDTAGLAQQLTEQVRPIRQLLPEEFRQMERHHLTELAEAITSIQQQIRSLQDRLKDLLDEQDQQLAQMDAELKSLQSGIFPFPKETLDLKEAIASRLRVVTRTEPNVRILAEVADLKDEKWRNAVEGFLHSQKYYLLVPPDHFQEAARVYDQVRDQQKLYGAGIIDSAKLMRQSTPPETGSLAEEIITEDEQARAFLNHVLGRVHKSEQVEELRQHATAITPQCMLYSGYVVRALSPERWRKPAIGRAAILHRLETLRQELSELKAERALCHGILGLLEEPAHLQGMEPLEVERFAESAQAMRDLPKTLERRNELMAQRNAIDVSSLERIQSQIRSLEQDIKVRDEEIRELSRQIGGLKQAAATAGELIIPGLREAVDHKLRTLQADFDAEWMEQTGAPRYVRELSQRGTPRQVANAFPRELSKARNLKEGSWNDLTERRRRYNDQYKMGFDVQSPDNTSFEDAWLELSENKLPEFKERIQDAKTKAFEQFQEDFLSRLQNNITSARHQIEELNYAIKGATFGEDAYRFRMVARPEYKRYYDMIMDDMLSRGYSLLSQSFNDKYKDEINDLFAIVTDTGERGLSGQDYEKKVHEFTDYRTYLTFDLEVEGKDGTIQRLSRTLGKKSGGETQTPFYIAVLASFAQLYRSGREKTNSTIRLIMFDEAFSKMDGERIIQSIQLLRRFNFQVILSAPPDKVADIATLVDRNLCVYRRGHVTTVQSFDPRHMEVVYEELD